MCIGPSDKPQTYKSFKAQKFEKAIARIKALRQSILDSSLKEDDKASILQQMRAIL